MSYLLLAFAQPQEGGQAQFGPQVHAGPQQHSPFLGAWLPHLQLGPQLLHWHDFTSDMGTP